MIGTDSHGGRKDLLQYRQKPVRCECDERQFAQPTAHSHVVGAQHESSADERRHRHALHDMLWNLSGDVNMCGCFRNVPARACEGFVEEAPVLKQKDLPDGAETLVDDSRPVGPGPRMSLSEA